MIGELCKKHDVIAVMDEVYEWIVYKGHEHVRMGLYLTRVYTYSLNLEIGFFIFILLICGFFSAQLPDMWERTITIGSAGKTFSVTGWKLGWSYGPEYLMKPMQLFHQNCVYVCSTLLQVKYIYTWLSVIQLHVCYLTNTGFTLSNWGWRREFDLITAQVMRGLI